MIWVAWSTSIHYIFVQVQWVMFVGVNFLVMFKFFGHIHLFILNRSSVFSSQFYVTGINMFLLLSSGLKCTKTKFFNKGLIVAKLGPPKLNVLNFVARFYFRLGRSPLTKNTCQPPPHNVVVLL